MSQAWETTPLIGRWRGLWDRERETDVDPMYARICTNVDLSNNRLAKRAGTRRLNTTPLAGRVHALHDAIFRAGPHEVITSAGAALQRVAEPPTTLPLLLPTGTPARLGDPDGMFLSSANLVFHVNGVDRNVKYDGQNVYAMGIEAPTVAPALAAPVAGPLTGRVGYRYTFVRAETQAESEPSPETEITLTAQAVAVTAAPSPDPQVNRTRLWRTTLDGGGVWLFVEEIVGNGGAFLPDTKTDAELGIEMDEFLNDPPPLLKLLAHWSHAGILIGVLADLPYAITWSTPGVLVPKDESWPIDNLLLVAPDDGDAIVAVKPLFDSVLILKEHSIWRLRGIPPALKLEPVHFHEDRTGIGGLSQRSVVEVDNDLSVPTPDGAYALSRWSDSGFTSNRISSAIDRLWATFGGIQGRRAHAVFHRPKRQIRLFLATPPLSDPDVCLVYQLDGTPDGEPNGWAVWTLGATASAAVQTGNGPRVYLGGADGFVRLMDEGGTDDWTATEDDGTAYTFEFAPVWMALAPSAQVDVRVRRLEIVIEAETRATLLVTPEVDFGVPFEEVSFTADPGEVFILDDEPPGTIPGGGHLGTHNGDGSINEFAGTPLGEPMAQRMVAVLQALGRLYSPRILNAEPRAQFAIEELIHRWQPLPVKRTAGTVFQEPA